MEIQRFEVSARRSDMVIHGNTLYIGGQVAENTQGDIEAQTTEILNNLKELLARGGSDLTKVLSVRILLADKADYEGLNRAWDGFFPEGHAPARACTLEDLINPEWRVEMIITAAR